MGRAPAGHALLCNMHLTEAVGKAASLRLGTGVRLAEGVHALPCPAQASACGLRLDGAVAVGEAAGTSGLRTGVRIANGSISVRGATARRALIRDVHLAMTVGKATGLLLRTGVRVAEDAGTHELPRARGLIEVLAVTVSEAAGTRHNRGRAVLRARDSPADAAELGAGVE